MLLREGSRILNTIENINKKMHVTGSLINLKTIQEHFEKINAMDICSEAEKQEIAEFLDAIEEEIDSIQEKIGFIRQMWLVEGESVLAVNSLQVITDS